jgi:hypothetical protein
LFLDPFEDFLACMVVRKEHGSPKEHLLLRVFPKGKGFGETLGGGTEFWGLGDYNVITTKSS